MASRKSHRTMVSFSCEVCNDTVVKKKLDQHRGRCHGAYFTCIDCSTTFEGTAYKQHTSCISEAEKYEKALYKQPKKKQPRVEPKVEKKEPVKPVEEKKEKKEKKDKKEKVNLADFVSSGASLHRVVKKYAASSKSDTKGALKKLKVSVNADGQVVLTL